ncbi:hypothetical protein [Metabacillus litoralis]|uniref:hypothetical protein n=1 Tax=Metabacillus litoralis TaxID=152268 RepID=UPI00203F36C9|nr:hypothetical protein [Metabacillus litoralis]MCM3162067.1 hypothetical protein [Metabacillus litoralis]
MGKLFPTSLKWLLFTFASSVLSIYLTGISIITLSVFLTGFIFSIGYLYKDQLSN